MGPMIPTKVCEGSVTGATRSYNIFRHTSPNPMPHPSIVGLIMKGKVNWRFNIVYFTADLPLASKSAPSKLGHIYNELLR